MDQLAAVERLREYIRIGRNIAANDLVIPVATHLGVTPDRATITFLQQEAKEMAPQVSVCSFEEDSTLTETGYVGKCLEPFHPANVLLVTSDWHTARARSVFKHRLPQYRWSVAAAKDPRLFGTKWWRRREWAKTTFQEWLKVIWWNGIDRWR